MDMSLLWPPDDPVPFVRQLRDLKTVQEFAERIAAMQCAHKQYKLTTSNSSRWVVQQFVDVKTWTYSVVR